MRGNGHFGRRMVAPLPIRLQRCLILEVFKMTTVLRFLAPLLFVLAPHRCSGNSLVGITQMQWNWYALGIPPPSNVEANSVPY